MIRFILLANSPQFERLVSRRKTPLQGVFANLMLANHRAQKKEDTGIWYCQTSSLSSAKAKFYCKTPEIRFCDNTISRFGDHTICRRCDDTLHRVYDDTIRRKSVIDERPKW